MTPEEQKISKNFHWKFLHAEILQKIISKLRNSSKTRRTRRRGEDTIKMIEFDVEKDEAFKAIKDSIPPEFDDPNRRATTSD